MGFLLADALFGLIGWIYMLLRHRNTSQMRIILKEQHENRYSLVGREIISGTVLIIFAVMITGLMVVTIYTAVSRR